MNGASQIAVTKIDYAFECNDGVRDYDNLTRDAKAFIEKLEDELRRPVVLIGTGQETYDIVDRR